MLVFSCWREIPTAFNSFEIMEINAASDGIAYISGIASTVTKLLLNQQEVMLF